MEEILSIIFDLKVWITIILGIILNKLVNVSPILIRGYWKNRRLKNLNRVRAVRTNPHEVNYEIAKANSYFIFFLLTCLMYLIFLIIGPLSEVAEKSKIALAILISPLYIVEIIWLSKDDYAKQLVKASKCLHIDNRRSLKTYR